MKKFFLFAALIAIPLMTACTQNKVNEGTEENKASSAIGFSPLVNKQTKAIPVESVNITDQTLHLRAYSTEDKDYNKFNGKPGAWINGYLTYNKGVATPLWVSDITYYWPSNDVYKLSFFSYSPATNGADGKGAINVIDPIGYNGNITYPAFEYTVADHVGAQKDLIVASTMNVQKSTNNGTVNLKYKHALTQVFFKAKTASNDFKMKITNIKVKGAFNKAIFTYDGTENVGVWDILDGKATHTYRSTEPTEFTGTTVVRVAADDHLDGSLMLIPQVATNDLELEVTYTTYTSGGTIYVKDIKKTARMEPLIRGKKYAYTLILANDTSLEPIKFTVDVDAWDDAGDIDIRFDTYELGATATDPNDAAATPEFKFNAKHIVKTLEDFAKEPHANPYTHTIEVSKSMIAPLEVNLSGLEIAGLNIPIGSKIILDLNATKSLSTTNSFKITGLTPAMWGISSSEIVSPGKITIIKK